MKILFVFTVFFLYSIEINASIADWFKTLERDGYDNSMPPNLDKGKPTEVVIQFYVESLGNFRILSMDYALDIYFVQSWTDKRLDRKLSKCIQFNSQRHLESLWVPDVYFANSKEATYNKVTIPNQMIRLCPGGKVRFSVRISITASCYMNLRSYPMDKQSCYLKILPYGNNASSLDLQWAQNPIIFDQEIVETDLRLNTWTTEACDGQYFQEQYSCLIVRFFLERAVGRSILQIYIPSFAIVCISWISFWIDPTSVPGRTGLAVTTLLTLATQAASISYQLPPVTYAKAVDVWMCVCLMFLFAALVEFAIVNMLTRQWISLSKKHSSSMKKFIVSTMTDEQLELAKNLMWRRKKRKALMVDRVSRALFPGLFCTFAIIYWCTYLLT